MLRQERKGEGREKASSAKSSDKMNKAEKSNVKTASNATARSQKVGDPTFEGIPDAIRAAVEGWLDAERGTEDACWALAQRSWGIKSACEADKVVAQKEERSPVQIAGVVKKF